ncbi:hypothetical protein SG34_015610 [Thalassomonas viridans]|uniref:Uncharacterized protein n=1 Tax=Thalassomonas viridans TaxID=137584 RepID=A0AAE9YX83_9GAMM|nr:hypothetical protein [Thalassomonas viridans]WDE02871.1 hypothetical protein SG34_015610 [Thalassomonas viridans]
MVNAKKVKTYRYPFTVVPGHGVASGRAEDSPYPDGTIALQKPFFAALGLDLSACFCGTINAAFNCRQVTLKRWDHEFVRLNWFPGLPAEDFRFASCQLIRQEPLSAKRYPAYIYQVVANSKLGHFQPGNVLELLAPEITGLAYGDAMVLEVEEHTLVLV